jgi:hypothetical protein
MTERDRTKLGRTRLRAHAGFAPGVVHSSLRAAHRSSSVDAFLQSVHLRAVSQDRSQAVAMPVAIASNYVFKPTAEGLSLRSDLAAGGGLTRR